MDNFLTILESTFATVQDVGRYGLERSGIPVNGAADQHSATIANILVGNTAADPLIEITATDFAFELSQPQLVAVTGAPADVTINGRPARQYEPLCVPAHARVGIRRIHDGIRVYIAVGGQLAVTRVLGSCAPDALLGVDQSLPPGAQLGVHSSQQPLDHPFSRHPLFVLRPPIPRFGTYWSIPVIPGPDIDDFSTPLTDLARSDYTVGQRSNHIGLRLEGTVPQRNASTEILSRGVPIGAVEVPPENGLLVLQRGRPITAGYPVIAVVTRTAQQRLGQAAPGHRIRFRPTSLSDAIAEHQTRTQQLDAFTERVHTAFTAVGLSVTDSKKEHYAANTT